ncbi:uncharacterized protein TNIN_471391 [Trichonephila inaurata madagascariensis]|uniref:Uncharacterized protein n=1 Tax=Trichonephila inaurata madagascariensis TaxID=2747483 RepID=A0A8X6YKR7_9ARAC|nr:uncharacterized protein TNIN_471391 [Trichonephila inaurata madagascariensis]
MLTRGIGKYTKHNPPRLREIAAIKVAIELCMVSEMRAFITKYRNDYITNGKRIEPDWKLIRYTSIREMLSFPVLDNSIRARILTYVPRLLRSIFDWIDFHSVNTYLRIGLPKYFMWTVFGTVDKKRTAEEIISSPCTDIDGKYKLACIYCLDEAVSELWDELLSTSSIIQDLKQYLENPLEIKQEKLVIFWSFFITDYFVNITDDSGLNVLSAEVAFIHAAVTGNLVAVEYFLQLPGEPSPDLLQFALQNIACKRKWAFNCYEEKYEGFTTFPVDDLFKVFYCLLSHLPIANQRTIIYTRPLEVIRCFLMSPRQKYLIKIFKRYHKIVPQTKFVVLFRDIFFKDLKVFTQYEHSRLFFTSCDVPVEDIIRFPLPLSRYNYRRLFYIVWRRLPVEFKEKINKQTDCGSGLLFHLLFKYDIGFEITDEFIKRQTCFIKHHLETLSTLGRVTCNDTRLDLLKFLLQRKVATAKSMAHFKMCFSETDEYISEKHIFEQKFKLTSSIIHSLTKIEKKNLKKLEEIKYKILPEDYDETSLSSVERDDFETVEIESDEAEDDIEVSAPKKGRGKGAAIEAAIEAVIKASSEAASGAASEESIKAAIEAVIKASSEATSGAARGRGKGKGRGRGVAGEAPIKAAIEAVIIASSEAASETMVPDECMEEFRNDLLESFLLYGGREASGRPVVYYNLMNVLVKRPNQTT